MSRDLLDSLSEFFAGCVVVMYCVAMASAAGFIGWVYYELWQTWSQFQ